MSVVRRFGIDLMRGFGDGRVLHPVVLLGA
jgi:hypothetical protein